VANAEPGRSWHDATVSKAVGLVVVGGEADIGQSAQNVAFGQKRHLVRRGDLVAMRWEADIRASKFSQRKLTFEPHFAWCHFLF